MRIWIRSICFLGRISFHLLQLKHTMIIQVRYIKISGHVTVSDKTLSYQCSSYTPCLERGAAPAHQIQVFRVVPIPVSVSDPALVFGFVVGSVSVSVPAEDALMHTIPCVGFGSGCYFGRRHSDSGDSVL